MSAPLGWHRGGELTPALSKLNDAMFMPWGNRAVNSAVIGGGATPKNAGDSAAVFIHITIVGRIAIHGRDYKGPL